ncbi:MAG: hypothetical protein IPG85_04640 [Bacteroidetes bacterium]|nr:hypothetical protein [Bacteroidota bacterium]
MKKYLAYVFLFAMSFLFQQSTAQTFGNEWIQYNQTYYKFKIHADSLYRIPISSLLALGMPNNVLGDNLQLFRDGQEVPIFVSNNAALNGNDYIEFYGTKANGKVEEPLYKNPAWQLNPNQNSVSDTAFYFITFNNAVNNKRFTQINNNLNNPPLAETYFWDKIQKQYRESFSGGPSYIGQFNNPVLYQFSSQFENGEGFSKKFTTNKDSVTFTCLFPYKVAGGPFATFNTTVVGNSYLIGHWIKVYANGNEIANETYDAFDFKRMTNSFPMTYLTAQNKITFRYTPLNTNATYPDRYGISSLEFRYPRLFNFNNVSSFYFELNPKPSDYYLEITNFNTGNVAPRLYDFSTNTYLIGDISISGKVRFLLPASNDIKSLLLQSNAAANYSAVNALQAVTFKNYTNTSNQGDYIIVSHKAYMDDGTGHNYLDDYKTYRSSAKGGNYQAIVADVQDVYNEFGYGYNMSTLAIKNFLKYAAKSPNWSFSPKHVFMVGKGISYAFYPTYFATPYSTFPFHALPSFGDPCSDVLMTDFDINNRPQISIGRIPVMNGLEIRDYLQKIKDHEDQVFNLSNQVSDSTLWKKRVLHLAGTKDAAEQASIVNALNSQANIITKPLFGGNVTLLKKGTTTDVETANSKLLDNLFNTGVSLIQFFGHSSSSTMDYNLDFPNNYKNYKKYPVFIANGCSAGDMFILQGKRSLGEEFVFAPNGASIAFIASDNTGYTNYLSIYTDSLYYRFANSKYGATLGEQIQNNVNSMMGVPSLASNGGFRTHTEQIGLNGDPATMMFNFPKPDYAVEDKGVNFKQLNLTTSLDSLDVEILVHNLGRYQYDTVELTITRTLPNNVTEVVLNKSYVGIANTDTVNIKIPTYGDLALGGNSLEVTIDNAGIIDEISEMNNSVKRNFTIYNDDLVPVYPYNLSIVNTQGVTLKGSTLNAFAENKKYVIQIDTTKQFNSPLLLTTNIENIGGVIKWQPNMTMRDSTVYYWRTAMDTLYGNHFHRWSHSSFIFINQGLAGWNQSHHGQFLEDDFNGIYLDSASRLIKFVDLNKKLQVQTVCLRGPSPYDYFYAEYLVKVNGSNLLVSGCIVLGNPVANLQFVVIDSITGQPWINKKNQATGRGQFGSIPPCRYQPNGIEYEDPFFEFEVATLANRNTVMAFFDSIPDGNYVLMRNRVCIGGACGVKNTKFINLWKADTLVNGSNVSLYHKIKDIGFTQIDSFTKNRPFSFFMKKGFPNTIVQHVGIDSTIKLIAEYDFKSTVFEGKLTTDKIGPAKNWNQLFKKGATLDATAGDTVSLDLIGIDQNNIENLLTTVTGDTNLSFIDASQYPYLRVRLHTKDNVHATAEQLKYIRIHYQPVPEAALNANRYFTFSDTIGQGQKQRISLAVENLTEIPMDSMLVKFDVIDKNKNKTTIATKRFKPLPILDTIHVDLDFNTNNFSGDNILVVEANPANDQLEQFHPNNIGFKSFYVVPDNKNPVIDVTFDGVHIFDEDIVSAKPFINITLKDENKYLALDDTSLVSVFLKYPLENQNIEHYIPFDGNILKFVPATTTESGKNNKATVEFRPHFTEDGNDYVLTVRAKDKSGNTSSNNAYKVRFEVVNKPMISSVINYPNPFTTSTQFIFTITGSQIPSNLKIQILSPTGKVVREIVKSELGNLHIGRNITEFKWKGDDQFGQPLGNGVYLYRFITNLNGNKMDHYNTGADKWIDKGFGKLYIMR